MGIALFQSSKANVIQLHDVSLDDERLIGSANELKRIASQF